MFSINLYVLYFIIKIEDLECFSNCRRRRTRSSCTPLLVQVKGNST